MTKEERLQRENELLKRQVMLLQGKRKAGGSNPSSEEQDPLAEMNDPLMADCDEEESVFSRPRSRSESPCDNEHATVKVKPTIQPRTRAQTVTASTGASIKPVGQPYGRSSTSMAIPSAVAQSGSVATPMSSSAPKSSASPVPMPRSNLTSKLGVSSVGMTAMKASSQPGSEDKPEGARDVTRTSSDASEETEGGGKERSSSSSSSHSSSSEKAKASLMLQKLLPRM